MTQLKQHQPPAEPLANLKSIIETLLDEARQQGASAAEAGISTDQGLSVTARLGEVETIEYHRDQGVGITVFFGHRKGNASTTDFSPTALKETVRAACTIASHATDDPYSGLPDPADLETDPEDLKLCHPWSVSAERAIDIAIECEQAALDYGPAITNSEGATVDTHQGLRVIGNSLGFIHGYPSTHHTLSCSVVAQHGDSMQRDYWYSVARDADRLESARSVGVKASMRAVRRLDAHSLTPRQSPVLYSAEVASGLIGHFLGAVSGHNLYRKTTFLCDSLGSSVFPPFIHLYEQPHLPGALASAPYDAEGVITRQHDLVRDGVVESYILSSYSARKLAMQTTGNAGGTHNLTVEPGDLDEAGLLKKMGTGLLVTELMGQGANLLTGDYSRGATGFWVENGEIRYPVEEITIAGNLRDLFANIVAVGSDVDQRSNIRTGSILIEAMTIAGN